MGSGVPPGADLDDAWVSEGLDGRGGPGSGAVFVDAGRAELGGAGSSGFTRVHIDSACVSIHRPIL